MKFKLASLFASFLITGMSHAAILWTNPITGTDPGLTAPYTAGQTFDPLISVSGISRGSGVTGTAAGNRYAASSWNTAAIDLDAYFSFVITPTVGSPVSFTDFTYTGQASGTGATIFAFRSSLDNFATDIGSPTATGATINLTGTAYQNVTAPIEFRLYGWGASAAGGTFSVNDFTFNGIVPEPACALLGALGFLGILRRRR